jgi:exodeoxyribonuclease-5
MKEIQLTRQQLNAIDVILERIKSREPITVFTGYAGTGKTVSIKYLISSALGIPSGNIAIAAYTGTAAKNITISEISGQTIHSLIYNPIIVRGVCVGFKRKDWEELGHLKLIIIDEHSMLPEEILQDLLAFNIPLLLVGDRAQLPPIGTPHRYFNTSHCELTEVHRQALDNPILMAATKIREGDPVPNGNYGNILLVGTKFDLNSAWLRKDVQFIVGTNKTKDKINLEVAGPTPFVGSKIMFLKNDKSGVTNGTFAEILKLRGNYGSYKMDVILDDGKILTDYWADYNEQRYPKNQFFSLAYAITTHKSQGATFNSPGVIVDEAFLFKGYEREFRYTALTRFTGNYPVAWLR